MLTNSLRMGGNLGTLVMGLVLEHYMPKTTLL